MSNAADFQNAFGALLANADACVDPALRRALSVHRNTSAKASQDALAANYPVVRHLVGREAFLGCAHAFLERQPPVDPRLCLYGQGFAAHVTAWPAFSDHPYLASVAALERLVLEALFAADGSALDASRLASGVDAEMPLAFHPATRVAAFDYPAVSLWLAHQTDPAEDLENISWVPEIALVTRPDLSLKVRTIDEAAHAFLMAPTLGAAAAAANDRGGDIAAIFSSLLLAGAFA